MSIHPEVSRSEVPAIQWPARFAPDVAPVHVANSVWIDAPPQCVWAWLVCQPLWSTWYDNAHSNWSAPGALHHDLQLGSTFQWQTFGVRVTSTVQEFVPFERIAWDARGFGLDAYHAWLLVPRDDGCWVQTEESQYGWGARLVNFLRPARMSIGHSLWLKSLAIQSGRGMPPLL